MQPTYRLCLVFDETTYKALENYKATTGLPKNRFVVSLIRKALLGAEQRPPQPQPKK